MCSPDKRPARSRACCSNEHGGAGLSQDTFLAEAFAETRFLRIGDGPDEVHRETVAKLELAKYAG